MVGRPRALFAAVIAASLDCSSGGGAIPAEGSAAPGTPPPPPATAAAPATTYFAQASDFQGFCHWTSAPAVPSDTATPVGIHGLQAMTVYWKTPPPHGSASFPVGTIILKESEQPAASDRIVFAMVKRKANGAGYNSDGADGWEWFSLQDDGNCGATILWRGAAAPVITTYTDLLTGDCNGCHGQIKSNDEVWDSALQLANF